MRIAFEAQLLMEAEKTGIGYVADGLLRALRQLDTQDRLQLNFYRLRKIEVPDSLKEYLKLGFTLRCARGYYTGYKAIWNILPIPYSKFFGTDADVTMFFNYYISPGVKGRRVTMFHDMAYLAFPHTVRRRTKMMLDANMKKACERADRIICVSEFTKQETLKYHDVDPKKLVVMPEGYRKDRFHNGYTKEEIQKARENYGLPEDYLLYLGTLEPRKNIERMVEAYGIIKGRNKDVPPLVLVGRRGWMYETIFERINDLGLEKDIIVTGYAAAEDVPRLLSGAMAFFFPSLYEGFGLPPLEAMACGTPVLTSDGNSLKEVAGDAAVLVDPFSVESIADGMDRIIGDAALRADLVSRGFGRTKLYTWEKAAKVVNGIFRELG